MRLYQINQRKIKNSVDVKSFVNGVMQSDIMQKDTTFTKIFVGGLPYHTTDKSLRQFFEVFGEIDEAVVITDRQTGKSRGYGFVSKMKYISESISFMVLAGCLC